MATSLDTSTPSNSWLSTAMWTALRRIVPHTLKAKFENYLIMLISDIVNRSSSQTREMLSDAESAIQRGDVVLQQVLSILHREVGIPPPPPIHLQLRVVGVHSPRFIESGFSNVYPDLDRALEPAGKRLKDFASILDFGCGCGRAIRALAAALPACKLYGADIDGEAIEWLSNNYSRYASFSVVPHWPPTIYEDGMFDFIFGISVMTHLPEDMQFEWLKELRRITRPGGYVLLTTHGEKHYKLLDSEGVARMKERGFFYNDSETNYGRSISLPDFYQNSYHSHAYIEAEWGRYFEIISIKALGMENHQDTVLLRKSPG